MKLDYHEIFAEWYEGHSNIPCKKFLNCTNKELIMNNQAYNFYPSDCNSEKYNKKGYKIVSIDEDPPMIAYWL